VFGWVSAGPFLSIGSGLRPSVDAERYMRSRLGAGTCPATGLAVAPQCRCRRAGLPVSSGAA